MTVMKVFPESIKIPSIWKNIQDFKRETISSCELLCGVYSWWPYKEIYHKLMSAQDDSRKKNIGNKEQSEQSEAGAF